MVCVFKKLNVENFTVAIRLMIKPFATYSIHGI